ncbi:hypothetical protein K435DRAFT_845747 [Dendrothele bispora CBS 962.96]|uniref:Uncharacterized protein n=1 Tax=Dendrothele bispora (strain CBS 962.96) TaxID=1314807 RepID=A0A4S8KSE2_DENBC|nr:hypothetical protein K435DRAFT_845747 [Dendrothele bispora CBS 962.96]
MDSHYDFDSAKHLLDSLQTERHQLNLKSSVSLVASVSDLQIRQYTAPRTHRVVRLLNPNEPDGFYEEVIFRLPGIIYERELPPIRRTSTGISHNAAPYLRQHIGITGLNLSYMTAVIENLHRLHTKFDRALTGEEFDAWSPDMSYREHESVTANCRYFMVGHTAVGRPAVQFQPGVDPDGVLNKMICDTIIHTEDNVVLYMKATKSEDTQKWRYTPLQPQHFSVGDIVEIQLTVMAVRKKHGGYRMMTVLKSVALLDDSISISASISRSKAIAKSTPRTPKPINLLKRLRYEDDSDEHEVREEQNIRHDLAQLRLADHNETNQAATSNPK